MEHVSLSICDHISVYVLTWSLDHQFLKNNFEFPKMPCSFMAYFDGLTNVRKGVVLKCRHLTPEFPGARCFLPSDMKGGKVGKGLSKCSSGMLISGH